MVAEVQQGEAMSTTRSLTEPAAVQLTREVLAQAVALAIAESGPQPGAIDPNLVSAYATDLAHIARQTLEAVSGE